MQRSMLCWCKWVQAYRIPIRHLFQQKHFYNPTNPTYQLHSYTTLYYNYSHVAMRAVDDVRQSKCNLIFTLIGDKKLHTARMLLFKYLFTFYIILRIVKSSSTLRNALSYTIQMIANNHEWETIHLFVCHLT